MKRVSVFLQVFLIILVTSSFTALEVQRVEAEPGTIYIWADGSIDPPTASISTTDNVTYTFADNINGSIVVERDDIVIDGAGYTLQETEALTPWSLPLSVGISLTRRTNVTIRNTQIKDFGTGIYLTESSSNSIIGNNITKSGISMSYSSNHNSISGNNITDGLERLTVSRARGIGLFHSCSYNSILGNNIINNFEGIVVSGSSSDGSLGRDNSIIGNTIKANFLQGIEVDDSPGNSIIGNTIENNMYGIDFSGSASGNNRFYHNLLVNNSRQARVDRSIDSSVSNIWDARYPSGGNYWSDYSGTDLRCGVYQNETGSDGIGDTSCIVDAIDTDRYPLMGMFHSYNVTYYTQPIMLHACNVTVISNSMISDFVAPNSLEHPEVIFLKFHVSGAEDSNGFCRVSFPTAMMNGTYHVSLNGTEIPHTLLPCSDASMSYLYFNYTHSTQEVTIRLESPLSLILPLIVAATLIAVVTPIAIIIYRRKHR